MTKSKQKINLSSIKEGSVIVWNPYGFTKLSRDKDEIHIVLKIHEIDITAYEVPFIVIDHYDTRLKKIVFNSYFYFSTIKAIL